MNNTPDNLTFASMYDAKYAKEQEKMEARPRCYECHEAIAEDSAFLIDNHFICENCIEEYRVDLDDYIDPEWAVPDYLVDEWMEEH